MNFETSRLYAKVDEVKYYNTCIINNPKNA
jgi:hypothetical protein